MAHMIPSSYGWINLDHVVKFIREDRGFVAHLINGDTETVHITDDDIELSACDFVRLEGYAMAFFSVDQEFNASDALRTVIGGYIYRSLDDGFHALVLMDGSVHKPDIDRKSGHAYLLLTPEGKFTDSYDTSFDNEAEVLAYLHGRATATAPVIEAPP